ncbi:glycosyltransferase family 4 protein [Massilia sp. LXY-6]|uniref:glycosyltransferase family 4 protein n=1 Tax=Massilia sp. LXY-6 TaxID=3379823 RepID=UPI003EE32EB7
MRVLHLLDHSAPRRSDYSRRAQALLEGLRKQGVQTVHLTGTGQADADGAGDGWHFYRTATADRRLPLIGRAAPDSRLGAAMSTAALALRLRQVARLTRPDLIHVHLPSSNAVAAWPVARLAQVPLVVDAERRGHALPAYPFPRAERWALGAAHAIATGTAQVRAVLRAEGLAAKAIAVVPQAPDLLPGRLAGVRMENLLGAPLLAYAGGLAPDDGLDLLLTALAQVRRRHPALRLLVAGGGTLELRFERLLAQPALRGHVVFAGPLSYRRAADVLPRADIAVFPALGHRPCLQPSRHLLNALAQGCAIVASDLACHSELLVHGHSGILFEAGSRAGLAKAILDLLAQPWRIDALGKAARDFMSTRRSWEVTAARYRSIYEMVLNNCDASR